MPRYTMFVKDGTPLRAAVHVSVEGWRFAVSTIPSTPASPSQPAHELAHVVQQNGMSSRWSRGSRGGASSLPRVGDEVLVSFEHGDHQHAILIVQPATPGKAFKVDASTIKQKFADPRVAVLDLGAKGARSLRLKVESKGRSGFSILGGTAVDAEFSRGVRVADLS